jgi:nicotinate-nucleotide--dimethylbenzimidazole phosphoribosyltransferase
MMNIRLEEMPAGNNTGGAQQQAAAAAERPLEALLTAIEPADPSGEQARRIWERLDDLTKPRRSLGRLERLAALLACIQQTERPRAESARVLVFAGDHGVCGEGVSAYLPEVTAQLCYTMVASGTVVCALARQAGASLEVVDVGVAHDFEQAPGIRHSKIRRGTRNLAHEAAMTRAEAEQALLAGAAAVLDGAACDVLAIGEVGIGNTTAAAALFALLTGVAAGEAVGRGTGVGDETLRRKTAVVERALARARGRELDVLGKLAEVGGLEIAALVGAILAAAAQRTPVVLDGLMTGVAAMVAAELSPAVRDFLIASHRSAEPAHAHVLNRLGLEPLLDLELRLGEASGGVLALPLLQAACTLLRDVRTFREAGLVAPVDVRGMR